MEARSREGWVDCRPWRRRRPRQRCSRTRASGSRPSRRPARRGNPQDRCRAASRQRRRRHARCCRMCSPSGLPRATSARKVLPRVESCPGFHPTVRALTQGNRWRDFYSRTPDVRRRSNRERIKVSNLSKVPQDGRERQPLAMRLSVVAVLGLLTAAGCDDTEYAQGSGLRAPPEAVPPSIAVAGDDVTVGFHTLDYRADRKVSDFRLTTLPVSAQSFAQCVAAGACSAPDLRSGPCARKAGIDSYTYEGPGHDEPGVPVTCVTTVQARDYCAWVGGRLPTVDEWLLAARGRAVRWAPWGDEPPTCDTHWRERFDRSASPLCCGRLCSSPTAATEHEPIKGLPESGLRQVLTTRAEIVAPSPSGSTLGCLAGAVGCYVTGQSPGMIDFLRSAPASRETLSSRSAASFRCAWEVE